MQEVEKKFQERWQIWRALYLCISLNKSAKSIIDTLSFVYLVQYLYQKAIGHMFGGTIRHYW